MDKTEIFTDKIQQCQSLQNMTCISMEVTFYESGSISPLFDFDGVCYFHDNFFQLRNPSLLLTELVLFQKFGL